MSNQEASALPRYQFAPSTKRAEKGGIGREKCRPSYPEEGPPSVCRANHTNGMITNNSTSQNTSFLLIRIRRSIMGRDGRSSVAMATTAAASEFSRDHADVIGALGCSMVRLVPVAKGPPRAKGSSGRAA
jgi:hypothetical protein